MGESHDVMNLEWVQSDIEQTLLQAQESLEACLSGNGDYKTQLKSCFDAVHQVAGSLQMVGLSGAVLLTEQMESLLSGMLNDAVKNRDDAYVALAQAMVHLPPYLARVKADVEESPILLLKAINDIHKVLGTQPILEYSMFDPKLGAQRPLASAELKTNFAEHSAANISKLRQIFQFALIGLIRNEDVKVNLVRVSNVLARLQQECNGSRINQLWEISCAMIEAMIGGAIELNTEVIELLRSTDKEIKRLAEAGENGLDQQPKENLLKGMLYHVAKTTLDSAQIQIIKQTYDLDRYQLSDDRDPHARLFVGPDKDTLNSAVLALMEELQRIKDTIDLYVRNEVKTNIDLGGLKPSLRQIASTLVMLNLEEPKVVVQEQLDVLAEHSNGGAEIPSEKLLRIAEALLYVESQLNGIVERTNSSQVDSISAYADKAVERVILESLSNMKQAKDDIQEFVLSNADFEKLENVPVILRSAYGGLSMIAQSAAAQLVFSVAQYIEDDILALMKEPQADVMDTLAEVVSTVEYYLEGLAEDKPSNAKILEVAKSRIASLGYPVEQSEGITSEDEWDQSESFVESNSKDEVLETAAPEDSVAQSSDEITFELDSTLDDLEGLGELVPSSDEEQAIDLDSDEEEIKFELPVNDELIAEPVLTTQSTEPEEDIIAPEVAIESGFANEEELVDEEILEIFAEEAEEVIGVINEHWPLYADNHSQSGSLSEVRRAFHTLKGSGRMVKASVISELAWSVENLLNHLIEESLVINQPILTLVDDVRAELPALLQHFIERTNPETDVAGLMSRADRLVAGEEVVEAVIEPTPEVEREEITDVLADELSVAPPSEVEKEASEDIAEYPVEASLEDSVEFGVQLIDVNDNATEIEQLEAQPQNMEDDSEAEEPEVSLNEIFSQEAKTHLSVLEAFIESYRQSEGQAITFTEELYRALHTLKGSARMASLDAIAEIAAASETLAKELGAYHLMADQATVTLLDEAKNLMKGAVEQLASQQEIEIVGAEDLIRRIADLQLERIHLAEKSGAGNEEELSPALRFLRDNIDPICEVTEQFEQWREQPTLGSTLFETLVAQVSSLNEAAQVCEQPEIETLLATLEYVYRTIDGLKLQLAPQMISALNSAHEGLVGLVDQLAASQQLVVSESWAIELDNALTELQEMKTNEAPAEIDAAFAEKPPEDTPPQPVEIEPHHTISDASEVTELEPENLTVAVAQDEEIDQELIEIFLSEADEIMEVTAEAKQRWIENTEDLTAVDELQRGLHTLKGSSRMAGVSAIGNLSHELESVYEDVIAGRINASAELFDLAHECDDRLADMVSELRSGAICRDATGLIEKVKEFHRQQLDPTAAKSSEPRKVVFDTSLGATVEADGEQLNAFFMAADNWLALLTETIQTAVTRGAMSDADHSKTFELLTQIQESAYTSEVNEIGDLCQLFAELVGNLEPQDLAIPATITDLAEWLERIESSYQEAKSAAAGEVQVAEIEAQYPDKTESAYPESSASDHKASAAVQKPKNETVRVPSALLEHLVDLAGETSVSRSRVEQQVSNFGYAIEEMASTIERLREQLRRMEIETEAQILFGQEREGPEHEGFDPLEMDRYSRIQELSRSLVESVSDLFDLKDTLHDRSRYTETLLLQQSRINTELQEGLMKTHMVPFARMAPRLQRVVRQVSSELNKKVELQIKNIDTEMDRSLLEHMTAPLEHMLRNAVDHGVELPSQRVAAGKPEIGRVSLELSRDGGDILLTLRDDGAGIDVDSVKAKAIERGLMTADSNLSDHQILQFIMQAGFSTAKQVTQISGRGVGMDVVSNEIKLMGGSIEINSTKNKGTCFLVRVPFAVSINRALMVTIGEEVYALPLSTIEGVVRVSPYELEEYYRPDGPDFEYAGQRYDLKYLGEYLGHGNSYQLQNQAMPLPVVLIRTAEHTAAVQVDSVSGSREIVVKPLGPQLGVIPGMSGATILGDGRVVLILDMAAMIRSMAAEVRDMPVVGAALTPVSENLQVMVVDDSVTVRKVASRLLERHGMDVVIAKDGLEAMTKLQDILPDIMLLDIEMPRMDGFELASLMRHDERLQDVPIVMITSRTGDKHRERALEIGVNRFMGKPFQESELLDAIAELTDFERREVAQAD